ncbi:MAG: flagellar motor switch phosphatase FliY [Firmicutes bacterium]|nr:flagellar motor switch phosphatase FliY [Bacillota bacterium]
MEGEKGLSQSEIDALLQAREGNPPSGEAPHPPSAAPPLTHAELDVLGELGNIALGASATTLSTWMGERVTLTTPHVAVRTAAEIAADFPHPAVAVMVDFDHAFSGKTLFLLQPEQAKRLAAAMLGIEEEAPSPSEEIVLSELEYSALDEMTNQMVGAASTALADLLQQRVDLTPPTAMMIEPGRSGVLPGFAPEDRLIEIAFELHVEKMLSASMVQCIPCEIGRMIADRLLRGVGEAPEAPAPVPPAAQADPAAAGVQESAAAYAPAPPSSAEASPKAKVRPARLPELTPKAPSSAAPLKGLRRVYDVPLTVTVELGRTHRTVAQVLQLTEGSVIELDKAAGAPVDIFVNGKQIAFGEVVVIDENFGIRITGLIDEETAAENVEQGGMGNDE